MLFNGLQAGNGCGWQGMPFNPGRHWQKFISASAG
jgi:hypothetical protein